MKKEMLRKLAKSISVLALCTITGFTLFSCGSNDEVGGVIKNPDGTYKVIIMEPMIGLGYFALHLAKDEGWFKEEGLDVDVVVSSAQVVSTLTGECFAHITSSDRNEATAYGSGKQLVTFSNLATRANLQMAASTRIKNYSGNITISKENIEFITYLLTCNPNGYLTVATSSYGSTPNTCIRYLLSGLGFEMDPGDTTVYKYNANGLTGEVHLAEQADETARANMVTSGQAQINCTAEPMLSRGIEQKWWHEHLYNFGDLGEFAYSNLGTTSANLATPTGKLIVEKLCAGLAKSFRLMKAANDEYISGTPGKNYETLLAAVKKEYGASYDDKTIKIMVNSFIEWKMWSLDGTTSKECIDTDMAAMKVVGTYTNPYDYSKMVDNSFIIQAVKNLK